MVTAWHTSIESSAGRFEMRKTSMAAPTIETVHVSVGCNRTPGSLDWGNNGLVCFGAGQAVAVYDPKFSSDHGKIRQTSHQHKGRVNCVRWIRHAREAPEDEFLSGSTDKTVVVWKYDAGLESLMVARLTDLNASVSAVCGIYWQRSGDCTSTVVAAVADNQLCVWIREGVDACFRLLQTFHSGPALLLDCRIHLLPGCQTPCIACAGDDGNVHLFSFQLCEGQLSCAKTICIAGHEDWVRALAFTDDGQGDVLLASAAQDSLIRIWRITCVDENSQPGSVPALQSTQGEFDVFFNARHQFKCALETVLQGHEHWVYGLDWQPLSLQGDPRNNAPRLLSCSMDKTMIIWGVDPSSGVWLDQVRVGEVGGNTLGLYGCRFGNRGNSILAHGYQGAFHLWHCIEGEWKPGVVCGGHFDSVEDLVWDPNGEYVVTVSADQTSRLHAPWVTSETEATTWHEISRPQVHGYDMSCIASLGRFRFASGAEEKVIRVFDAPQNFLENLARISNIDLGLLQHESGPQGAAVPALGLSNKPVYQGTAGEPDSAASVGKSGPDQYAENYFTPTRLEVPPTEETLLQNTLWPEIGKLYGHGYELFSLAADPAGKLLVSAARAQQTEHAAILLWNVEDMSLAGRLSAHTLTVSQMAFSPDGQRLVSVSRDRTWAVHEKYQTEGGQVSLRTIAKGSGGSRILWSCHWSPDSRYFVTGSRDRRVIVWEPDASGESYRISGKPLECEDSVTAVAFCPSVVSDGVFLLAIGLDSGPIHLYNWNSVQLQERTEATWSLVATLNQSQAHHLTVKRLQFRPISTVGGQQNAPSDERVIHLASCGSDNLFKMYSIRFPSWPVSG